jgi:hypothetical protein
MKSSEKMVDCENQKMVLQTVWIFAMLNYIYCDIIAQMDPEAIRKLLSGELMPFPTTPGFWLGMSVLMEIPIAMVLLSRVLKYPANRWANIIAGVIMTLVQISSTMVGTGPTLSYLFFSAIEIASTMFIVWYAWKWTYRQVNVQVPA